MTTTNPPHAVNPTVRRLERGDGPIGGVAAGLADYFNVDPTVVRLGIVATTLISGPVIPVCYVASWIIIPRSESVPMAPAAFPATAPPPPPPSAPPATAPTPAPAPAPAPSSATDSSVTDSADAPEQETGTGS
ncbi:MAG: PspC domain-containing protein [Acidimicrobiales bacterium]